MDIPDFTMLSPEDVVEWSATQPAKTIQAAVPKLSIEQIPFLIVGVSEYHSSDWMQKTDAVIAQLNQQAQLEMAGKALSASQFLSLLQKDIPPQNLDETLLPLLVGLPQKTFRQVIASATEEQLVPLKREGVSEPVQHHLSLLAHEITNELTSEMQLLERLQKQIETFDPRELTHRELDNLYKTIQDSAEETYHRLEEINCLLAISWNSNRIDLVEKFTNLKGFIQKQLLPMIGTPRENGNGATGLFEQLEKNLNAIFGNPFDPQDIEALDNDDPAIDALAKFAIWYLRDYWEIGLLPGIKHEKDLDLSLKKHSEKDRSDFREKLFSTVLKNLEKIGLSKVKDLKKARIYSRDTLQEFIQTHHL